MAIARLATAAAAMLAPAGPALAGPLLIAPTTVQFAPGRRSAVVEVTNQSSDEATLQLRAFAWSQPDGHDRLVPTSDLIVSPPIVKVPAHARQVFRVLDAAPGAEAAAERSYRLRLNELPTATVAAVGVTVEFSLPVFVTPRGATPDLSVETDGAALRVSNRGTRHLRLSELAVVDTAGAERPVTGAQGTYVLAGATRRLEPADDPGRPGVQVTATTDAGVIHVPLAALATR